MVVMVLLILLGLPHYLRRKKPRSAQFVVMVLLILLGLPL